MEIVVSAPPVPAAAESARVLNCPNPDEVFRATDLFVNAEPFLMSELTLSKAEPEVSNLIPLKLVRAAVALISSLRSFNS